MNKKIDNQNAYDFCISPLSHLQPLVHGVGRCVGVRVRVAGHRDDGGDAREFTDIVQAAPLVSVAHFDGLQIGDGRAVERLRRGLGRWIPRQVVAEAREEIRVAVAVPTVGIL